MTGFYDRIRAIQEKNNSLLCVGLDPDLKKIPGPLLSCSDPRGEFCERIVQATKDLVCAYKLNLAFFEGCEGAGWSALKRVLASIPDDVITIGDGKRGDIGNTAEMYAGTLLDEFRFTATTVNPYMGEDSIRPFIKNPEQGAFVLALTSNPGAKDFQYLLAKRKPLYEHVVAKAKVWNQDKNIGLVVGATHPAQLKRIRFLVPEVPLLIPGVGAQEGNVELTVRWGCDARGTMALVNASRSIIYASSGEDFADAARISARSLRDEMNVYRRRFF